MQGLFRNPLADPGLIGVSSGAALAATAGIVLGAAVLGPAFALWSRWLIPLAAFVGALVATLLVTTIGRRGGRTVVATMLLAGVAIAAIAGAGIGFLVFLADDEQLRDLTFWGMGSLGGATWARLSVVLPPMLLCVGLLLRCRRDLNTLVLGETAAGHLGVTVEVLKRRLIVLVALSVGCAVAVSGAIGFVGLVVPHLLRLACGPDHRLLLPASALGGAILLLCSDLAARTLAAPAELPIGVITAGCGGRVEVVAEHGHAAWEESALASAWLVCRPTRQGWVHSLEGYDSAGRVVASVFGHRPWGEAEDPVWTSLIGDRFPRAFDHVTRP